MNSAAHTLPELLSGAAAAGAGGVRYLRGDGRTVDVSYRELWRRAVGVLGEFQRRGVKPGDAVVLFVRDNAAFIDAFWACQLGGLVPVPLSAGVHREYLHKLAAICRQFHAPLLYCERDLLQRFASLPDRAQGFAGRTCLVEDITELGSGAQLHRGAAGDTALIQFSSGSTSAPKGVVLSHANLLSNIRAISRAAAITRGDVSLSWMPLSHDMGLIGFHLVPLYNALKQVLMDTGLFLRRPARWLEAAQAEGASLLCSPNFGYQHYLHAVPRPSGDLNLSGVRLIFNGAEPVSAAVCRNFTSVLAGRGLAAEALYPVYGLAEASLAVTFPVPGLGVRSLSVAAERLSSGDAIRYEPPSGRSFEVVCLGQPVDGCELRICAGDGTALPASTVGHVWIRGTNVTGGYYRCPDCDPGVMRDGWLDTGDLGFLDSHGLYVTGRARDVLFVHGQNWYPQDLEQVLQETMGLAPGKVAVAAARNAQTGGDQVLVFVQYRRGAQGFAPIIDRVRAALAEHTGLHADAVLPAERLPRTSSGKLQRYRLAEAFARGEYRGVLAELDGPGPAKAAVSVLERELLEICQRVLAGRAIGRDQNLFELGADSLMLVSIHEEIDSRFPGRLEVTDLFDHPTIAALAGFLGHR